MATNEKKNKLIIKLTICVLWMAIFFALFVFSSIMVGSASYTYRIGSSYDYEYINLYSEYEAYIIGVGIALSLGMFICALIGTVYFGVKLRAINSADRARKNELLELLSNDLEEQADEEVTSSSAYTVTCKRCQTPIEVTQEQVLTCPKCYMRYKNPLFGNNSAAKSVSRSETQPTAKPATRPSNQPAAASANRSSTQSTGTSSSRPATQSVAKQASRPSTQSAARPAVRQQGARPHSTSSNQIKR